MLKSGSFDRKASPNLIPLDQIEEGVRVTHSKAMGILTGFHMALFEQGHWKTVCVNDWTRNVNVPC